MCLRKGEDELKCSGGRGLAGVCASVSWLRGARGAEGGLGRARLVPCLRFLRPVDRRCMRWVSEVWPRAWVPPLPVLRTLEEKGRGRLGLDSPRRRVWARAPFLNVFVMTSAQGLLAARPAGQA